MDNHCNLCNETELVLEETSHYKVVAEKYPIVANTILLITREHHACHASVINNYLPEFIQIKAKITAFLRQKNNTHLIFFEHGIAGQTIHHAHLHCIASPVSIRNKTDHDNPQNSTLEYSLLGTYFIKNGPYYLLEEDQQLKVYKPTSIIPGYFRKILAQHINQPSVANWQTFRNTSLLDSVNTLQKDWQSFAHSFQT